MEVKLAGSAGFCFGVKRAVNMVYEHAGDEHVYTYGPIIHNKGVVSDLQEKGVGVVRSLSEVADLIKEADGKYVITVVIRSHGISKSEYDALEDVGAKVIDATCPFVKKIHNYVSKMSAEGYDIIIVGDGEHPEVKGIMGWASTRVYTINEKAEAQDFVGDLQQKYAICAQTTFNSEKFKEIVEIIAEKGYNYTDFSTVCNATKVRQDEAMEIASMVDIMIVVGDVESSNSRKLYQLCSGICSRTYFIQTLRDLNVTDIESLQSVGITAGASTPDKIIEEVHEYVRTEL